MKIVTLGEIMLRLTPRGHARFVQAEGFSAFYGGAEANVAVALANWGEDAAFVSKVPAHAIGQAAVNALRRWGVDTRYILRGGERLGIYFSERGADRRSDYVVYDRANSAFAASLPEEYDWNAVFEGASLFHFTGITPALGERAAAVTEAACKAAKERGVAISCDVNYRSKLWGKEQACEVLGRLLRYADICIANENQARSLFGLSEGKEAEELFSRFGCGAVALTYRRTQDALHNRIWGELYTGGKKAVSRTYDMEMIDRIGGGDAFAAGVLYAHLHGFAPQKAVEFAEAASCLKHSIEGDACIASLEEVTELAEAKKKFGIGR